MSPFRTTAGFWIALAALSITATVANWLKLGSFWGDAARSVGEMYRASLGERPYVDFSFSYPPAAPYLIGALLRTFGSDFTVLQLIYSTLSALCVYSLWVLCIRIFDRRTAAIVCCCFLIFGSTSGGAFALYSLQIYTPAILIGATGLLLSIAGLSDLRSGGLNRKVFVLLSAGGVLSATGKAEAYGGAMAAFTIYAMEHVRRKGVSGLREGLILPVAAFVAPAAVVYGALALTTDGQLLSEGLGGYGLAAATCTWWPSGFPVVGGLVALTTLICWSCLLQIAAVFGRFRLSQPGYVARLATIGIGAGLVWACYSWAFFAELTEQQAVRSGPLAVAYMLVTTNTLLLPFMWAACVVTCWGLWMFIFSAKPLSSRRFHLLLLTSAAALISVRTLFGSIMHYVTQTTPMSYVVLFPLIPLILVDCGAWIRRLLGFPSPLGLVRNYRTLAIAFLCVLALVRLASYAVREGRLPYETIRTAAGPVRVSDGVSAKVFQYLNEHTSPGESIADFAYGGGLQFALKRSNPLFSTQFVVFRPSASHRQRDLQFLRANPTRFIVGREELFAQYGSGAFTCAFPQLLWRQPPAPPSSETFPVIDFARQNYRRIALFDNYAIFERRPEVALESGDPHVKATN